MKKKILTVSIALILIAIFACLGLFMTMPKNVAEAMEDIEVYLYCEDPNNPLYFIDTIISNKPIGLYANPYRTDDFMFLYTKTSDTFNQYAIPFTTYIFPMQDGVTYDVFFTTLNIYTKTPVFHITYDLELPYISVNTDRTEIENGAIVIGQNIEVKAHDNLTGVKLFVSKDNGIEQQCTNKIYQITEEGTYKFYAVDVAGNYSEDFTITYYKQEPTKEPDGPIVPDEPITPTNPITPEEPIMDSENTTSQDVGRIVIVVIIGVIFVATIGVIAFKKVKNRLTIED